MNFIKFAKREDFGTDWYVQVLFTKRWALFQASVSWNDCPSWPYLQIKFGNGCILSIMFWAYRFGFDVGIIERTWNWDWMSELPKDTDNITTDDDCMPPWGHSDMEALSKYSQNNV